MLGLRYWSDSEVGEKDAMITDRTHVYVSRSAELKVYRRYGVRPAL
jgi:hypothetical protein